MKLSIGKVRFLVALAALPLLTVAQQTTTFIPAEPSVFKLADLFRVADTVALVKVVSGDTENYDTAVYKATVLQSFKGPPTASIIYFGPYIGERLGWEYVLFLRAGAKPAVPSRDSNSNYGTVSFLKIFNEGYSSMETSYECVFPGKNPDEHCDYSVRICTDYIVLPKSLAAFPPSTKSTDFGCRWVRKEAFVNALNELRGMKK